MRAIVSARNLGIRYALYKASGRSLRRRLLQMLTGGSAREEFWALRNVSLDLREGETLGLIGSNGAGKSTLCLALAKILWPDEGEVEVRGRVAPILALGTGFSKDMTGRENIQLSGALMGLEPEEIREVEPGIIEFADIGEFIESPVRTYSSGMRARLAFAVATSVEPDVLILDEILGVGDAAFKEKSAERMRRLMDRARAVILVSHAPEIIRKFCSRTLWLEKGAARAIGPSDEVLEQYAAWLRSRSIEKRKKVEKLA